MKPKKCYVALAIWKLARAARLRAERHGRPVHPLVLELELAAQRRYTRSLQHNS